MSSYPYVQLTLDALMSFSSPIQCNSTSLDPYNQTGLQFKMLSPQQLQVWNFKQLTPSTTYELKCRLRTTANKVSSSIYPSIGIELHHNYTLQGSHVAGDYGIVLNQAPAQPQLARPFEFSINNPQVLH